MTTTSALICLLSLSAFCGSAQDKLKEANKFFEVPGGVQNIDKKVLKESSPQSLPYVALKFRTGSAKSLQAGHGTEAKRAKTYAILDGVDSTLFQEITNEFNAAFLQKLKDAGVTFLELSKIKATKAYAKMTEETSDRNFDHKDYGTAHVYTNNNEPFFYYPTGGMKITKYTNEFEAGLSFLRLTIDFVEFDTEATKEYGWSTTTTKFSAEAYPTIKVTSAPYPEGVFDAATGANKYGGFSMSDHKKYFSAIFLQKKPIYTPYVGTIETYDDKIPKFASKKFRMFGGGTQLGTFVITAQRDAYKKAALEALSKYTDMIVEIYKSYNTK